MNTGLQEFYVKSHKSSTTCYCIKFEGRKAARLYELFQNWFSQPQLLLLAGIPICHNEILMNLVGSTIIMEPILYTIRVYLNTGYVELPVCQTLTYSSFKDYVGKAIHVNPNQFHLFGNNKLIDSNDWSHLNCWPYLTTLSLRFTNEMVNVQCKNPLSRWPFSPNDQIPIIFPATYGDIVSYMSLKHDIHLENIDFSRLNLSDTLVKNGSYSIPYSASPKPKISKFYATFYLEPTSEVVTLPLSSNSNFYFVAMMLCDRLKCCFSQIFFSLKGKNNQRISKSDLVYQYSKEVISVDFESTVYITWIDPSTRNPVNLLLFFTSQETVRDLKMTIIKQMNIRDLDPSYILIRDIKTQYEYPDAQLVSEIPHGYINEKGQNRIFIEAVKTNSMKFSNTIIDFEGRSSTFSYYDKELTLGAFLYSIRPNDFPSIHAYDDSGIRLDKLKPLSNYIHTSIHLRLEPYDKTYIFLFNNQLYEIFIKDQGYRSLNMIITQDISPIIHQSANRITLRYQNMKLSSFNVYHQKWDDPIFIELEPLKVCIYYLTYTNWVFYNETDTILDLKQKFLETMTKEKKIGKDVKLTDLLFQDSYRKELQDTQLIINYNGIVWAKLRKNVVTSKQIEYKLQSSILTKKMTVSSTDSIESIQHAIEVENHLMNIPYDFRSYSSSSYWITFKNLATNIEFQLLDDLKVQIENASNMNLDQIRKQFVTKNIFISPSCKITFYLFGIEIPTTTTLSFVPEGLPIEAKFSKPMVPIKYSDKIFLFKDKQKVDKAISFIQSAFKDPLEIGIQVAGGGRIVKEKLTSDKNYSIYATKEFKIINEPDKHLLKKKLDYLTTVAHFKNIIANLYSDEIQLTPDDIVISDHDGIDIQDPTVLLNSLKEIHLEIINPGEPITLHIIFEDPAIGQPYNETVGENIKFPRLLKMIEDKFHTGQLSAKYKDPENDKLKFFGKESTAKAATKYGNTVYISKTQKKLGPIIRKLSAENIPSAPIRTTAPIPTFDEEQRIDPELSQNPMNQISSATSTNHADDSTTAPENLISSHDEFEEEDEHDLSSISDELTRTLLVTGKFPGLNKSGKTFKVKVRISGEYIIRKFQMYDYQTVLDLKTKLKTICHTDVNNIKIMSDGTPLQDDYKLYNSGYVACTLNVYIRSEEDIMCMTANSLPLRRSKSRTDDDADNDEEYEYIYD